jgi:hypothetical protein
MATSETVAASSAAQEDYVLFNPQEGKKDKEGRMFMVRIPFI